MAIAKFSLPTEVPPTTQAYHEVQLAFDFFNIELFDTTLPPCLLTFQRKGSSTYGFYSPKRFASAEGRTTDEIARRLQQRRRRAQARRVLSDH